MWWAESETSGITACTLCITTEAIVQHNYSTLKMTQQRFLQQKGTDIILGCINKRICKVSEAIIMLYSAPISQPLV